MRAAAAALSLALAFLFVGACTARSYAGVSFAAGVADPEVQALARRAQAGDKQAQLELGIRYEEGRGVEVDLARAESLYEQAARTSNLTRVAYVPAAGHGGRAMSLPVSSGVLPGVAEAGRRLERLRARLAGMQSGQLSPSATRPTASEHGLPVSVATEAFADLVILDFAFDRCVSSGRHHAGDYGSRLALAMRACFHATALPPACPTYRRSIERAAELVATRQGLEPLAFAAVEFLNACPRPAAPLPAPPTPRTASSLTIIEWLLGRTAPADRPRFAEDASLPLGQTYLPSLCSDIVEGRLRDFRASELLLCADPGEPDGYVATYRAIIRRLLMNGDR